MVGYPPYAMTVLERIGQALRTALLPPSPRVPVPPLQPHPMSLRDPALTAFVSSAAWTDAPVAVTEASALHYPAVWAAVQTIAGDVASLPFVHFRKTPGGGRDKYETSKLYGVLHDIFNPEMDAMIGRETMTAHLLLWGNAYAEIQRNDLGQVVALWPIEPNRVSPERAENGAVIYRVQAGDGRDVIVPTERMLHVVGLGFNGLMGYSVIGMMRDSLGVAIATERLGGQVMERGAKYSGFFLHPRTLGATAHKNLKESITSDLPGSYRILEEGMTYTPGSMSLSDAQYLEIRKYSVTEVARIFGIPPHKLGDLERATFSNVEEENISYVTGTLRRWMVRWEKAVFRKLIPSLERSQQTVEHNADALMRGKTIERATAHNLAISGGWMSFNEARALENLNPIPGGDTHVVQGAMVPLDRLDELVDKQVRPPPAPVLAAPADDEEPEPIRALPASPAPAMCTLIAGRLVRRELAQLRKRVADPTAAMSRLEKFYRRFVAEGVAELKPWMPEPVATRVLTTWADAAIQACVPALAAGRLDTVLRAWALERDAHLTRTLMEAIDG